MVELSEACAWLLVSGECVCTKEVGWMPLVSVCDDDKGRPTPHGHDVTIRQLSEGR